MTLPMPKRAERYDRLAALYADERFTNGHSTPSARQFIGAVYWSKWLTGHSRWSTIQAHMGWRGPAGAAWRMLLCDDLPRFTSDGWPHPQPLCEHVLTGGPRKGDSCGKPAKLRFRITDPTSGEWRTSGWCSKHYDEGLTVEWRENHRPDRDAAPTPHPNRGGVLPCYLTLSKGASWEDAYRWASPSWVPPEVGVCADDWPTLAKVRPVTRRPKLTLILGDIS